MSASEDTLVEEYFETLHMIEYFSRQPKSGTESAAIDASGTVTDAKGEETVTVSSSDEMGKPDKHKRSLKELKVRSDQNLVKKHCLHALGQDQRCRSRLQKHPKPASSFSIDNYRAFESCVATISILRG